MSQSDGTSDPSRRRFSPLAQLTKREAVLFVAFILGVGGLLISDSAGRALLAAPVSVGITLPRWAAWSAALLAYGTSLLLRWRPLRLVLGVLLMHAFIPVQPLNPLPWIALQEVCLLAFVVLVDLNMRRGPATPDRPRRGPAVALRQVVLRSTAGIYERRRKGRAN